jgi:hypothetical protein
MKNWESGPCVKHLMLKKEGNPHFQAWYTLLINLDEKYKGNACGDTVEKKYRIPELSYLGGFLFTAALSNGACANNDVVPLHEKMQALVDHLTVNVISDDDIIWNSFKYGKSDLTFAVIHDPEFCLE